MTLRWTKLLLLAVAGLGLGAMVACRPELANGQFSCDPGAAQPCPEGFACLLFADEYQCHRPSSRTCGNGKLEPTEECDGNDFARRGCSDYEGRPVDAGCDDNCFVVCCGNGLIEGTGALSEDCDDGNERSHDGCSSACTRETPFWVPWVSTWDGGRNNHSLTYFPPRGTVILFGGNLQNTGNPVADTWEYDGVAWSRLHTPVRPPPRAYHAMVYDATEQRLVLFGGLGELDLLDDTWVFDGDTWEPVAGQGPPARMSHAMAFDRARGVTVLYGGKGPAYDDPFDDTWELSGTTWTQRSFAPGAHPPGINFHTLVYDHHRERTYMMGGLRYISDVAIGPLETIWALDGNGWENTGVELPFEADVATTYDSLNRRTIAMGATQTLLATQQVFTWDGLTLQTIPTYVDIEDRDAFDIAYDEQRDRTVLFGGTKITVSETTRGFSDTWEFDGQDWRTTEPTAGPTAAFIPTAGAGSAAMDPSRHELLLVTGGDPGETWILDSEGWRNLRAPGPSGTAGGAPMIYDSARERFVIHGVVDPATQEPNQTWTFDGNQWQQVSTSGASNLRGSCALMTYDPLRERAVLVGGVNDGTATTQTWELDEGEWQPGPSTPPVVAPIGSCPQAAMTYDASQARIVLFGGIYDPNDGLQGVGTWTYDGTTWSELETETQPAFSQSRLLTLSYHPLLRRSVLFVRNDENGFAETWELIGKTWIQTTPVEGPASGEGRPVLVFDERRSAGLLVRAVLHGEQPSVHWTFDVWKYIYQSSHPVEHCEANFDEDLDGLENCDDPDCAAHPHCESQ